MKPTTREIDELVALQMGWTNLDAYPGTEDDLGDEYDEWVDAQPYPQFVNEVDGIQVWRTADIREGAAWSPSTNVAHAWEVVERMVALGYECAIVQRLDQGLRVEFDKRNPNIGETTYLHGESASTFPMSVCLAALKATAR